MRKITSFILLSIFAMIALVSCDEEPKADAEIEYVTVGITPGGEINTEHSPLSTKAPQKCLYGIQVWEQGKNVHGLPKGDPIAYGIFNDLNQFNVKLIKGRKYDFEIRCVINGEEIMGFYSPNNYDHPFNCHNHTETTINQLFYNDNEYLYGLDSDSIVTKGKTRGDATYNTVDNYYGIKKNYTAAENEKVTVDLYRMVFGIKLRIKSEDSSVNKVLVQIPSNRDSMSGNGPDKYYIDMVPNQEFTEYTIPIICVRYIKEYWENLQKGKNIPARRGLAISIGTVETPTKFYSGTIPILRNTMHTLNLTIKNTEESENMLGVTFEDQPMRDTTFVLNNQI